MFNVNNKEKALGVNQRPWGGYPMQQNSAAWSLGAGSRMRHGANAMTAVHGFYVQLVDCAASWEERGATLATVCAEVCMMLTSDLSLLF